MEEDRLMMEFLAPIFFLAALTGASMLVVIAGLLALSFLADWIDPFPLWDGRMHGGMDE